MNDCAGFARWLDDGMPADGAAAHAAHAAACARCAAALADARALDRALERALVAAPADFADRVMAGVARTGRRQAATWVVSDVLPWWVRALADPAAVLAAALAALVLWQYPLLSRVAPVAWRVLSGSALGGVLRLPGPPASWPGLAVFADPYVLGGLGLAGLPVAWWAGLAIYRWSSGPAPEPRLRAGAPVRH